MKAIGRYAKPQRSEQKPLPLPRVLTSTFSFRLTEFGCPAGITTASSRSDPRQLGQRRPLRPTRPRHRLSPIRLRKRLRSTSLLERSLGEVRRRIKVIGRFPGETSCLSLCWAVLDLVIAGARGLGLTAFERQQLAQMRSDRLTSLTMV